MCRVISLFAGCGGSSLGYALAGGKVLAAVEYDANAAAVYRENFPQTRLYETDIALLDPAAVLAELNLESGVLDILDGSPPCQGFSMAGKRRLSDPRNRLFEEYVRFLRAFQPRAFVMENVPGMARGRMRAIFHEIIRTLTQTGYCVRARILNAAHYGVPQNRERVIILGFRHDLGIVPVHPVPATQPMSFREAVRSLSEPGLMVSPTGRALTLARALKPGQSGDYVHTRYGRKGNDFSLVRAHWDKPCPTVLKSLRIGQAGLLHPSEERFLSIGELKRVCAFPDDFRMLGTVEEQWARLGNAVPPQLTQAIASSVMRQLEEIQLGDYLR